MPNRLPPDAARWEQPKPQFPDRDRAIVAMREGGATLAAISRTFGLSTERVRQILRRHSRLAKQGPADA